MSKSKTASFQNIEKEPLKQFTERAYLDYSMYVILDRALPHISDGLKPVQRRIIYAMSELGLTAIAKYKKSARTIGDVLGKFHPHGDSACYEAMVLMAQDFSYRYPLVDGQGNWGSPDDPKSFAAMRYTEAKLSRYAELLLSELDQGTVNWVPNFDGTMDEPKTLPARMPNVLLNGTTGIAVGMSTDIPPHNMLEVADACVHLLDNPKATVEDLCKFILGPDFPTEGEIITPKDEILRLYKTGNGSLRMRAVYTREDDDIVITALPHMVSGSKVLEQIAGLMQAKKLPLVSDLRDESDHENPTRFVITPRSNRVDFDALMMHLFATTDLERSYRVNLNVIGLDGRPQVKDLKMILSEWLTFRVDTVRKRLHFRLEKVISRLHLLDGFLIAYLNIDEVIAIIRKEDNPKPVLMKRFKLSEIQTDAILDLKLRHLAKLEEQKIKGEQKELAEERAELEKILNSETRLKTLVKKELQKDASTFGNKRRSPIVVRSAALAMQEIERTPSEPVTVILSEKGWVRAGKGHELDPTSLSYKTGDSFKMAIHAKSDDQIVFMDSTGRAYTLVAKNLPSARGQGEPLSTHVNPPPNATFVSLLTSDQSDKYLMISNSGYGFIVPFSELMAKNKNGKAVVSIKEGNLLLPPKLIPKEGKSNVAIVSSDGRLLIIPITEVPEMAKGKGNKLISLPKGLTVAAATVISQKSPLTVVTPKKKIVIEPQDLKEFMGEAAHRGLALPKNAREVLGLE